MQWGCHCRGLWRARCGHSLPVPSHIVICRHTRHSCLHPSCRASLTAAHPPAPSVGQNMLALRMSFGGGKRPATLEETPDGASDHVAGHVTCLPPTLDEGVEGDKGDEGDERGEEPRVGSGATRCDVPAPGESSPAHGLRAGLRWLDNQGVGEGAEEVEEPPSDLGDRARCTPVPVAQRMERVRAAKAAAAAATSPYTSPVASPPRADVRVASSGVRPLARQTSEEEDFRI